MLGNQQNQFENLDDITSLGKLQQIFVKDWLSQAVYVAAKLGIADLLKDGAKNIIDLAQATSTDANTLYRLLRALASVEIFAQDSNGLFHLTPMAEYLQTDHHNSMRGVALMYGESWHWQPWGNILESVKTGKSAFECVYDVDLFQYMEQNPEASQIFNGGMTSLSTLVESSLPSSYDFSAVQTLVDVGGGIGTLIQLLLREKPNLQGILFDLPYVISEARNLFASSDLRDRCKLIEGNFFEAIPPGGDIYILKHIIHDWDDQRAISILSTCHRAMAGQGKLLIIERLVPHGNEPSPAKINDLEMLVLTPGGRERAEIEFKNILEASGFELTKIYPTDSPLYLIEAVCR